jgi:hypothetical protein
VLLIWLVEVLETWPAVGIQCKMTLEPFRVCCAGVHLAILRYLRDLVFRKINKLRRMNRGGRFESPSLRQVPDGAWLRPVPGRAWLGHASRLQTLKS